MRGRYCGKDQPLRPSSVRLRATTQVRQAAQTRTAAMPVIVRSLPLYPFPGCTATAGELHPYPYDCCRPLPHGQALDLRRRCGPSQVPGYARACWRLLVPMWDEHDADPAPRPPGSPEHLGLSESASLTVTPN